MKKKIIILASTLALLMLIGILAAATRLYGLLPEKFIRDESHYLVACIGDSLTYGLGTDQPDTQSYPGVLSTLTGVYVYKTENYGFSGATVDFESRLAYADTLPYRASLNTKADIVLLMLGTNDAIWSPNQTDFKGDYRQLLETYINLPQAPKVIVLTPPHLLGVKGYDDLLDSIVQSEVSVASELGLPVIDVYGFSADMAKYSKDGVHFTAEGYQLVADYVYKELSGFLSGK